MAISEKRPLTSTGSPISIGSSLRLYSPNEFIFFNQPSATRSWTYLAKPPAKSTTRTNRPRPIQVRIAGRFQTNSPGSVYQAVLGGLGIAQISAWMGGGRHNSGVAVLIA
ncbi:hypothetical protein [Chitinimonas sp. BJB300]|uniref:hypothetical protein n=1 Tax=Chitinimonas sp. BJB300 TaxID=1559339 RepID=UPI001111B714|nr:hypothetical protein [Chitinimonas sp. BJB300]TSJ85295.1 hypothetical protein FG002_017940 [Chitinimonas sp. BJB300]